MVGRGRSRLGMVLDNCGLYVQRMTVSRLQRRGELLRKLSRVPGARGAIENQECRWAHGSEASSSPGSGARRRRMIASGKPATINAMINTAIAMGRIWLFPGLLRGTAPQGEPAAT